MVVGREYAGARFLEVVTNEVDERGGGYSIAFRVRGFW